MRSSGSLFTKLVEHVMGRVRFYGIYRYEVVSVADDLITAKPKNPDATGLSDVLRLGFNPGVPGLKSITPQTKSTVLVMFVDGSESDARIVAFEGPDEQPGKAVPIALALDASATMTIGEHATEIDMAGGHFVPVREGDSFTVAGLTANLTSGVVSGTGVITITSSKSKVKC